ncbi:MAG: hypothetical protein Q4G67_15880 [Actinomycetia bacterium]|nr:hypothetical protein [Actinomycetes bacterium]
MTSAPESAQEYPDRWSPQRKAWLALFLWPLVITAAAVLWYLSFRHQLPEQVATHWGRRGADGFTHRDTLPWVIGILGLSMPLLMGAVVLAIAGRDGGHRRTAVGFAAGIAVFMAGLMVVTAWDQRGLADAALARDIEWPLILSLLVSIVVGVLASFTVPGNVPGQTRAQDRVPQGAPRVQLEPGERAVWSRVIAPGRWFWLMMGLLIIAMVPVGYLTGAWAFTAILVILVVLPILGLSVFRVTVGESGLVVRGGLGFPRWQLPLEDVAEAKVATEIDPMGHFGGWGYRMGLHGTTGFVVRKGPGLEVERGDGTSWMITVDEPEAGAALLNTLADRAR